MKAWLHRRLVEPLLLLLKQGVTPEKLALSSALGFFIALFPALGITTLLAAGAALIFRLNLVAVMTVNYIAYPLQFVVIIPLFRAGAWFFGESADSLSASALVQKIRNNPYTAIQEFWWTTWHAAAVWLALSLICVPVMAWALTPVFRRFVPRSARAQR